MEDSLPLYHTKNYQGTTTWAAEGLRATRHYTIPRTTRELQLMVLIEIVKRYYTIPRTTRELQPPDTPSASGRYYTIPRTTRELQLMQT